MQLAQHLNTVIISADSRQFYRELSIGTAKPTVDEMGNIKHYMIDCKSIEEELTAASYMKEVLTILEYEFNQHNEIILVGGSGMFIDAVCYGLDDIPHSPDVRQKITKEYQQNGLEPLLKELEEKDPVFYHLVDQNNPSRIIRALEVIRLTGLPFSSQRTSKIKQQPFEIHYFVIQHKRDMLYTRINERVDIMIQNGLEQEAKRMYPYRAKNSLQTVGYRELFQFFEQNISRQEAIELIKQNSRRYAKRQETWFRRNPQAKWIPFSTNERMIEEILQSL